MMPLTEAIEVLRQHQAWRRDDTGELDMLPPATVGMAIDALIAHFDKPADGYAYRFPGPFGGIRFDYHDRNGYGPIETLGYRLDSVPERAVREAALDRMATESQRLGLNYEVAYFNPLQHEQAK